MAPRRRPPRRRPHSFMRRDEILQLSSQPEDTPIVDYGSTFAPSSLASITWGSASYAPRPATKALEVQTGRVHKSKIQKRSSTVKLEESIQGVIVVGNYDDKVKIEDTSSIEMEVCIFLEIPLEIREIIYGFVMGCSRSFTFRPGRKSFRSRRKFSRISPRINGNRLRQASRQVDIEYKTYFAMHNTFGVLATAHRFLLGRWNGDSRHVLNFLPFVKHATITFVGQHPYGMAKNQIAELSRCFATAGTTIAALNLVIDSSHPRFGICQSLQSAPAPEVDEHSVNSTLIEWLSIMPNQSAKSSSKAMLTDVSCSTLRIIVGLGDKQRVNISLSTNGNITGNPMPDTKETLGSARYELTGKSEESSELNRLPETRENLLTFQTSTVDQKTAEYTRKV